MGLRNLFQRFVGRHPKQGAGDITMETPRLILREIELTDKQKLLEITNVPGFSHYCFDGSEEKVDAFLKKCLDSRQPNPATGLRDYMMLAIADKTTGEFVGCVSLEHKSFVKDIDYELNFFVDLRCQNKGYGREAAVNIMDFAFNEMKVPAINVTIEPANGPSLRVAYTEGYKDTGVEVSIDTPCFGTRAFKVLLLDKSAFDEQRKHDKKPMLLPKDGASRKKKSANDNLKP